MKKINKNNELMFNKGTITELNDNKLYDVNGGSTWACVSAISVFAWNAGVAVGNAISDALNQAQQEQGQQAMGAGDFGPQN